MKSLYRNLTLAITLSLSTVLLGASSALADEKPVVLAIVNGDSITTADIDRKFMSSHMSMTSMDKAKFDYQKLLDKLVNDRLIVQEAELLQIDQEDAFFERFNEKCSNYRRKVFLAESFKPEIEISDKELLDRFNRFYWKIQLRSVSLRTLEEAQQVRADILDGAPMDSIAEASSLDSRRFKGGLDRLKYWIDVITAFRPAVENLKIGQISEPVQYREAFTVLRVENRLAADTAEINSVSNTIKRDITKEKRFFAWQKFKDSLESVYPVEVDPEVLAAISADAAVLFDAAFLKNNDRTAITVAGEPAATETDLRNSISHQAMNAGTSPFDSVMQMGIAEVTENAVFDYAARVGGFDDNPLVIKYCNNFHDSTLIEIYLQETVIPEIVFRHDEFDQYFEDNKESFRLPDQLRLDNFLIKSKDTVAAARKSLDEGADFSFVARKYHADKDDRFSEERWYGLNTFPPTVSAALDSTPVGGTTEAFPVADGWVVFRIIDRKQGDIMPPEDVESEIRKVMFQKKFNESMDRLLTLLKDNSEIVYFDDRIADYLGESSDE